VFPWVIANYTSPVLDLSNPANFRDLSKPIGAVNPERLEKFRARMEALADADGDSGELRRLKMPCGAKFIGRRAHSTVTGASIASLSPHPAGDIKPFLYGSHYSNAGFVTFYLLRLEPFTSLHIELQGGHFDCPDRLFFSAGECWKGVTSSMTDVKVSSSACSSSHDDVCCHIIAG